jgi:hypothetical protein
MSKNVLFLTLTVLLLVSTLAEIKSVNAYTFESESDVLKVVLDCPDSAIYLGQPIDIIANVSGGTVPYSYQWITDKILNQNPLVIARTTWQLNTSNFSFIPDSAGTYHVSVAINDSEGHSINISPIFSLYFKVILPSSATPLPSLSPIPSPTFSPLPSATPSPTIKPTLEPTSTPIILEPPEIPLYTGVFVFVAVVLVIGLVVIYFKRLRK